MSNRYYVTLKITSKAVLSNLFDPMGHKQKFRRAAGRTRKFGSNDLILMTILIKLWRKLCNNNRMGYVCFIKVQHLNVFGCCYCVVNCSYFKYKHQCEWLSRIRHDPYGRRHLTPLAVSLARVCASPAKPVLAGVYALPAPTGRRSRLSADIGRES